MEMTIDNLCDSCTNIGCEFQSGIVRTECAFYMPPHIEPDNCGNYVIMQPEIEAIPKADIQKAIKEGSKDISENVLAIVREEYISKADYETRLKADMVAMLEELYMEIEELDNPLDYDFEGYDTCVVDCEKLIQQKINSLKEQTDGNNRA